MLGDEDKVAGRFPQEREVDLRRDPPGGDSMARLLFDALGALLSRGLRKNYTSDILSYSFCAVCTDIEIQPLTE